ncbi:GumC family protein [Marinilabilia rubra]|uniref:non-specific protein-tyrosine kinase n=1 Tax=Marinilabilia rubra TaxID=2162893 RepID=A0A2U2BA66_9BACT|nr:tyrosine-protein kinase [Marinilabilia rubra]PWD99932.1 tyrosine protein kinase [Marinilabilia rubra]
MNYKDNFDNNNNKDHFTRSSSQDLVKFFRRILDKWYFFISGLIIALTFAFIINKFTHPVYHGQSTILIRSGQNKPVGAEALVRDLSFSTNNDIRNEIGILKSFSLTQRTLESLNLEITYKKVPRIFDCCRINSLSRNIFHKSPIVIQKEGNKPQLTGAPFFVRILSTKQYLLEFEASINGKQIAQTDTFNFGNKIKSPYFSFSVHLRNKYAPELFSKESSYYKNDYSFEFNNIQNLVSKYRNNLEVDFYYDDASILELNLEGAHPDIVTTFLNQHARSFIARGLEEKNRIASATIDFIDQQISGISDSLQEAESNFQKFRAKNKVINISTEGNYAMEKLESLVTQKSNIQRMSKYYDYLYDYIQNQNEFDDVIVPSTMGISDQSLNNLVNRLGEAYSQRNRLLMTARKNSPQVQQITSEIESIRQALIENVRNIINTTQIEIEEINKQIEEVNKQIRRLPGTEREYINIQRDFQLNDNIYTFLLQKRSEAGIALASNVSDHKIIDPALKQTTYKTAPRPMANLIIAGLLGLLIPGITLILGDSLNTRINSRFNIEEYSAVPVLGHIEHSMSSKKLPVIEYPRSPLAESFRALRTNIDFMIGKQKSPAVIALTSSISGEGKSFCSANLGAILAITGKKVLVVGMDLRKPQTHTEFNIDNKKGLSNLLIGTSGFNSAVVESSVEGLYVIPSGPIPPNPAELLQSEEMNAFMAEAKKNFDFIILDTPPLALVADTLLITEATDLNLFILRQGVSRKQAIEFINHLSESQRIKNAGLVVNDVKILNNYSPVNRYGYGYGYSRFRKSGYYE